ncbi:ROK family protein [Frigoribacterium sp. PhB116]|uniref:ROK family protein n=1 Tax=Frigoribacterium sp. PhB116 TaxID=2485174 RepID=UPI00106166A0|nr:ROK family protein [Frigoribacterium sp. PhB116]TDT64186.1 glucokinase [Frigoribacterium sp. PhB116]
MTDYALAVDVGGTKVEAALVAADGVLSPGSRDRRPTGHDSTSDQLADAVRDVVRHALAALGDDDVLVGAGIGSAGPVDLVEGTVSPINLPSWRGFPLRALVVELLAEAGEGSDPSTGTETSTGADTADLPVTLRLDGVSLALAEHWVGATQGVDNAVAITVSTGVGGGLIVNGRLLSGGTGNAGHIGQIQIADRPAGENAWAATLEVIASGPNVVRWAQQQGWQGERGEDLAAGYVAGDEIAVAAVRRSANAVGEAISSVTTLLDLDVAAIGGGFSRVSDDYLDLVRATVEEAPVNGYARRVRVVRSGLSDESPLVGAAALVWQADLLG